MASASTSFLIAFMRASGEGSIMVGGTAGILRKRSNKMSMVDTSVAGGGGGGAGADCL